MLKMGWQPSKVNDSLCFEVFEDSLCFEREQSDWREICQLVNYPLTNTLNLAAETRPIQTCVPAIYPFGSQATPTNRKSKSLQKQMIGLQKSCEE